MKLLRWLGKPEPASDDPAPTAPSAPAVPSERKLSDDEIAEVRGRYSQGEAVKKLAEEFGVSRRTIDRYIEGVARASQPPASSQPEDPAIAAAKRRFELRKLELQLGLLENDSDFQQKVLFGDARSKTLNAETMRRVHEYDEEDGWVRERKTRLEDLLETEKDYNKLAEQLHKFQLEQARSGQGSKLQEVRGIVEMVKPMIEPYLQGAGARFTANVPAGAVVSGLAQPAQLPPGAPAPSQAQPTQGQEANAEMDFLTMAAKANLEGKAAPERAAWLASLPMLSEFIPEMCSTPDGQLLKRIESTAATVPMYRGVMTWIGAQGEPWVIETVRELRKLAGGDAATATATASAGAPGGSQEEAPKEWEG